MATKSYWYAREHVGEGIFHLLDGDGASAKWKSEPSAQALCGKRIASEDGKYDCQYEGDMLGWPTCAACFKRAE
jgi:hypothetical protein